MNLQLDTHSLLWYVWDDPRFPDSLAKAIEDPVNTVFVSIVSLWEIGIKHGIGKLSLGVSLEEFFAVNVDNNGFRVLPLLRPHILAANILPLHHRDPFDRLLIAQCQVEGMTFVTDDAQIAKYSINQLS